MRKASMTFTMEDRMYVQMVLGVSIGIVLGIIAFAMVTTCSVGSLCNSVDAAESLPIVERELRAAPSQLRLVPQYDDNDLDAIIVEWVPQAQSAMEVQSSQRAEVSNGTLQTGHMLSAAPDSMPLDLDADTLHHLIALNARRKDSAENNFAARDWMIITGSYNVLTAAELDAEAFRDAGYDIQIFFRNDEFRTAIVGYDSSEAASIDLVQIRQELRNSAQLGQLNSWCEVTASHGQFLECGSIE